MICGSNCLHLKVKGAFIGGSRGYRLYAKSSQHNHCSDDRDTAEVGRLLTSPLGFEKWGVVEMLHEGREASTPG